MRLRLLPASTGVPCSVKWIDEFGYVTMPMLAMTAFAAILALLLVTRRTEPAPQ